MIKITVIIPVYNVETYIEKAVRSIMNQTMQDIEIICVDDASPANEEAIIKKLQQEAGHIHYIRHDKNKGAGGARNSGIKKAKGAFLQFLDGDDWLAPEALASMLALQQEHDADMVMCAMERIDIDGQSMNKSLVRNQVLGKGKFGLLTPDYASPCNKIWRRNLFVEYGVFYPENSYVEDEATAPRLLFYAKTIATTKEAFYKRLVRQGSVVHSFSPKHLIDHMNTFFMLKDFLIEKNIYENHKKALQTRMNVAFSYRAHSLLNFHDASPEVMDYLKMMLMMKWAFNEYGDVLHHQALPTLQTLGAKATHFHQVHVKSS